MFTMEVQQALRALVALASTDHPLVLGALAHQAHAPAPALAKVLTRLARMGLVTGRRGPGGGYSLARPADEIRLADVVVPMQGASFGRTCLFGLPHCSDEAPCPLHPAWGSLRKGLLDLLESDTLASLTARPGAGNPPNGAAARRRGPRARHTSGSPTPRAASKRGR